MQKPILDQNHADDLKSFLTGMAERERTVAEPLDIHDIAVASMVMAARIFPSEAGAPPLHDDLPPVPAL